MTQFNRFNELLELKQYEEAKIIISALIQTHPNKFGFLLGYLKLLELDEDMDVQERLKEVKKLERAFILMDSRYLSRMINKELRADFKARLVKLQDDLARLSEQNKRVKMTNQKYNNSEVLAYLRKCLDDLSKIETRDEFDLLLSDVKRAESRLIISQLEDSEQLDYDHLIDSYAEKISQWTAFFANLDLNEYNQKALKSFKAVLDNFRTHHKRYRKKSSELFKLLEEGLFCYDLNKLFREVAEFYNFAYNYIFSRLDNDDKYSIVQLSLTVKKI